MKRKEKRKRKKTYKVSKETYEKVFKACGGVCVLCGRASWLEAHHVRYRSERRDLIDEPSNLVMLCKSHHLEVHSNKRYWQPILLEIVRNIYK